MLILAIRTDSPEPEIGLYDNTTQLAHITWHAHRELSATLHYKIDELLASQRKQLKNLEAIVCYEGPGSFTSLRVGITVADTIAYSFDLPIVAAGGEEWAARGIARLRAGENQHIALPLYGREARITAPKH